MRTGRKFSRRSRKGQSLVELALILPLLLMIVMGVIDFGRLFGSYIALQNASREGARFASLYSTTVTVDEIKARAISEAAATGYPGIRADQVLVEPPSGWRDGDAVTVRMIYPFQLLTTTIFGRSQDTITVHTTMVVVGGA